MGKIFNDQPCDEIVFRCGDYEGSIHLLVSLCKNNGYDVFTVRISDLIDQYFEFIRHLPEENLDFDIVSDFLLTASILLEIKARAMLQENNEEEDDTDDIDPEEELKRRMAEYKIFSEQAVEIKKSETLNRFYREPTFTDKDARVSIKGFDLNKLMEAFANVMYKFTRYEEEAPVKTIERDEYTVAEKIESLINVLKSHNQVNFFDLFKEGFTKNEVINTFLALLQLMTKQFAVITQENIFGDIVIALNPDCNVAEYDYTQLAIDNDMDEIKSE